MQQKMPTDHRQGIDQPHAGGKQVVSEGGASADGLAGRACWWRCREAAAKLLTLHCFLYTKGLVPQFEGGLTAEGATGEGGNCHSFIGMMLRWMARTEGGRRRAVGRSGEGSEVGGARRSGGGKSVPAVSVGVLDVVREAGRWEVMEEVANAAERRKVSRGRNWEGEELGAEGDRCAFIDAK